VTQFKWMLWAQQQIEVRLKVLYLGALLQCLIVPNALVTLTESFCWEVQEVMVRSWCGYAFLHSPNLFIQLLLESGKSNHGRLVAFFIHQDLNSGFSVLLVANYASAWTVYPKPDHLKGLLLPGKWDRCTFAYSSHRCKYKHLNIKYKANIRGFWKVARRNMTH